MNFQWPLALLGLLVVPLALAGYLLAERRRMRYAVNFTNLDVLATVVESARPWRRYVPPALALLSLATIAVGFARPRVTVSAPRENATVVLVIDTSGSMRAKDVTPTRFAAAKLAVERFLDRVPGRLRVGLVAFSTDAQTVATPTTDRKAVRTALTYLEYGFGTAIGDAIARAVETGRASTGDDALKANGSPTAPPPGKAEQSLVSILLLSDGHQTQGVLQPLEAAQRAASFGIPIFTVALGTPEGEVTFRRGGFSRTIAVPPDPETLKAVAENTGGEFFEVTDAERLKGVYERLGSRVGRVPKLEEVTSEFLAGGAALLLLAGIFSARWLQRLP